MQTEAKTVTVNIGAKPAKVTNCSNSDVRNEKDEGSLVDVRIFALQVIPPVARPLLHGVYKYLVV